MLQFVINYFCKTWWCSKRNILSKVYEKNQEKNIFKCLLLFSCYNIVYCFIIFESVHMTLLVVPCCHDLCGCISYSEFDSCFVKIHLEQNFSHSKNCNKYPYPMLPLGAEDIGGPRLLNLPPPDWLFLACGGGGAGGPPLDGGPTGPPLRLSGAPPAPYPPYSSA